MLCEKHQTYNRTHSMRQCYKRQCTGQQLWLYATIHGRVMLFYDVGPVGTSVYVAHAVYCSVQNHLAQDSFEHCSVQNYLARDGFEHCSVQNYLARDGFEHLVFKTISRKMVLDTAVFKTILRKIILELVFFTLRIVFVCLIVNCTVSVACHTTDQVHISGCLAALSTATTDNSAQFHTHTGSDYSSHTATLCS